MEEKKSMISFIMKYYCSNWKEAFSDTWMRSSYRYMGCFILWDLSFPIYVFDEISVSSFLLYYVLFLPLAAAVLHSCMYPNRLEKTMFLCPMEKGEKRKFLEMAYHFRIACVAGSSMVIIALLLMTGLLRQTVYLAGFFISEIVFADIAFLGNDTIPFEMESTLKIRGYGFWRCVSWLVNMMACLILGVAAIEASQQVIYEEWDHVLFFIIFAVQLLVCVKMMTYCGRVMEIGADYEKSYLTGKRKENGKNS